MEKLKLCSKCNELKSREKFYRDKNKSSGLSSWCKKCVGKKNKKKTRGYSQEDKERIAEYRRKYQKEHEKELLKKAKEYYQKNKEREAKRHKEYYEKNREKFLQRSKEWNKHNVEYSREYRQKHKERDRRTRKIYQEKNREKIRARHRRYQEANKNKIRERSRRYRQTPQGKLAKKISDHRYYARKMNCKINDLTTDQVRLLLRKTTHCAVCLKRFKRNDRQALDHIVPLSKGGNNTLLNLQIAHLSCNSRKGNRHYANYGDGQLLLIPVFQESPFKKPEPIIRTEKKCRRCKMIRPIDSFHKNRRAKDSHIAICKECMKIRSVEYKEKRKRYFAERPDEYLVKHTKELERKRQWRKEKVKQDPDYYKKRYYRDLEGSRRRAREHRERHKEYYQEYARGYSGKYYKKNKSKLREKSREYHSEHKEQQNERTREWRKRHPDYYRDYRRRQREARPIQI